MTHLEINAHGNPSLCDHITVGNASTFGGRLARLPGISPNTRIYLSGCNTGTRYYPGYVPIGQQLAQHSGLAIHGALGYISGTRVEGTDAVNASLPDFGAYLDGINAQGLQSWKLFNPAGVFNTNMGLKILTTPKGTVTDGSCSPMLANGLQARMQTLLESAMSAPGHPAPAVRAAPDVVLEVDTQQGVKELHIIGNYHSVKDPQQNRIWPIGGNSELHDLLLESTL